MKYSITQYGKALSKKLYTIDEKTKTFSSTENELVLDFNGLDGWTFKTGNDCTFKTGNCCTFTTGNCCTFDTWDRCTFTTGYGCTFKTGYHCTFKTEGRSSVTYTWNKCFEVHKLDDGITYKLNEDGSLDEVKETHIITIDGKDIEMSEESFTNLKEQLTK